MCQAAYKAYACSDFWAGVYCLAFTGVCADAQSCNAQIDEAASRTGTSTVVGVCVTPKPTGSACAAGYGKNTLETSFAAATVVTVALLADQSKSPHTPFSIPFSLQISSPPQHLSGTPNELPIILPLPSPPLPPPPLFPSGSCTHLNTSLLAAAAHSRLLWQKSQQQLVGSPLTITSKVSPLLKHHLATLCVFI